MKLLSRNRFLKYIIGGIFLLAIIAIAFVFNAYSKNTGQIPIGTSGQVSIIQPSNFSEIKAQDTVTINAVATGPQTFIRSELWVDGILMGESAQNDQDKTQYAVTYWWQPKKVGHHSIIVRAFDINQQSVSSPPLTLNATGNQENNGGNPQSPNVYPPITDNISRLSPSSELPSNPPPASNWKPNLVNWIGGMLNQQVPTAPELIAQAGNCSAVLNIHDLSDNEQGFRVFRSSVANPGWSQIATLSAQSNDEWLEYIDQGIGGLNTYYIVAFNNQGEGVSNYQLVEIDPVTCGAPSIKFPALSINFQNLITKINVDKLYCYKAIGNNSIERFPSIGFLPVTEGIILVEEPLGHLVFGEGENIDEIDIALFLHCWGWNGNTLVDLGEYSKTINPSEESETIDSAQIAGEIIIEKGALGDLIAPVEFTQLNEENDEDGLDFDISLLGHLDPKNLEFSSDQMPLIVSWLTDDPNICDQNVEKEAVNFYNEHSWACAPLPGYNYGPGGTAPQQYLVWKTLDNTCPAMDTKGCLPLAYWQNLNSGQNPENNWNFYWVISGKTDIVSTIDQRTVWRAQCPGEGSESVSVRFRVWDPINQTIIESKSSNPQTILCGHKIGDSITMEVTFNAIAFGELDDDDNIGCIGEDSCDDIEVYGRFEVGTNDVSIKSALYLGLECGNPESDYSSGYRWCVKEFNNLYYPLNSIQTCKFSWGDGPYPCDAFGYWAKGNNTISLELKENEPLFIFSALMDHDGLSANDTACWGGFTVGPRSLNDWASTANESHDLILTNESGNCAVNIILNAK